MAQKYLGVSLGSYYIFKNTIDNIHYPCCRVSGTIFLFFRYKIEVISFYAEKRLLNFIKMLLFKIIQRLAIFGILIKKLSLSATLCAHERRRLLYLCKMVPCPLRVGSYLTWKSTARLWILSIVSDDVDVRVLSRSIQMKLLAWERKFIHFRLAYLRLAGILW